MLTPAATATALTHLTTTTPNAAHTAHTATSAAASTAGLPAALLALTAALVVTLGYAFTCWLWPFKPCRRCQGTGKRRAPFSHRAIRIHHPCNGTGLRLRTGRRAYEYLRTQQRNANPGTRPNPTENAIKETR